MKRDIDLARQLLFDIEAHGANCALTSLRANVAQGTDERVRYHLRLLIDAGMAKEIDRTDSGVPCVRMTNAGHEMLELCRSDARWHDAKQHAAEVSGGQSLTVIRAMLTKWAVEATTRRGYHPIQRRPIQHRIDRTRRYYNYYLDREPLVEDDRIELARTWPDYRERLDLRERDLCDRDWRERFDWRDAYDRQRHTARYADAYDLDSTEVGVSLPVYIV